MITAKLFLIPQPPTIEGQQPTISVRFHFFGDKEGVKFWNETLKNDMPKIQSAQEIVSWADQYFAEHEFWPGPITQLERIWFLPNKNFFKND